MEVEPTDVTERWKRTAGHSQTVFISLIIQVTRETKYHARLKCVKLSRTFIKQLLNIFMKQTQ